MEFTDKKLPRNNEYSFWLQKRCAQEGHDFMLRVGLSGVFYQCAECGQRLTVAAMKSAIENHGAHEHEYVLCHDQSGSFYECFECGEKIATSEI